MSVYLSQVLACVRIHQAPLIVMGFDSTFSRILSRQGMSLCVVGLLLTDEAALVKGAKKLGFVFTGRTPYSVIIEAVRGPVLWKVCI